MSLLARIKRGLASQTHPNRVHRISNGSPFAMRIKRLGNIFPISWVAIQDFFLSQVPKDKH